MGTERPLRIGYVPEHFSTPIYFAKKYYGLSAELVPFLAGTGHMITSLRAGEIDVGIGLTEGWVAGLGKEDAPGDGGYRLVGTYVETPLCKVSPFFFSLSVSGGKAQALRPGFVSHTLHNTPHWSVGDWLTLMLWCFKAGLFRRAPNAPR